MTDYAFVVTQVGASGSVERRRADEISDYIVAPILAEVSLEMKRSDRDPTPGQITPQILRSLLEARLVIADLTGRNPNVYYELAVAHSFARPVICMVDKASSVAFDTKDERLIQIGEYDDALKVPQAEEAKAQLRAALRVVLAPEFRAPSPISEVAAARSLDAMAPENPVASELTTVRESLQEIKSLVTRTRAASVPTYIVADRDQMRHLLDQVAETGSLTPEILLSVDRTRTSGAFDRWLDSIMQKLRGSEDPWATNGSSQSTYYVPEDPPF